MKQKDLLLLGKQKLKEHNIQQEHEKAKKLLQFILNQNAQQLIVNALEEVNTQKQLLYETKLQEIIQGKPVQYIVNVQEFMGLNFYVDENVLIPQPDTEILVQETLKLIKQQNENNTTYILDLCTGSGAIAVSLAKYTNNIHITASDISKKAIEVAKKNAIINEQTNKIKFVYSNLFEQISQQFNYIVSNPPYIETSTIEKLSIEVKNEPIIALDGGVDGLHFYRKILEQAPSYLKENGYLLLEIGYNQANKIIQLHKNKKNKLTLITQKPIKDLGGNDRVLIFQKEQVK